MRNLATCYSEHAVRVSDSYCSAGSLNKSYVTPKSIQSIQNSVTCTYKSHIFDNKFLYISITWCTKLISQNYFFIKISDHFPKPCNNNNNNSSTHHHGFHQIRKIKGFKSLKLDSSEFPEVDLHWDLSLARFVGPEPVPRDGFHVAVTLPAKQCALVLGDGDGDVDAGAYLAPSFSRPELVLVSQHEQFIGGYWNGQINSRVKIRDTGVEHEITIKCGPEDDGPRNPVLTMYVDKKRVVKVKKLQWNFRGNQVIFVEGLLVDVMWDLYGWYFDQNVGSNNNNNNGVKNGCGLFMFRTRNGLDSRLWLEEKEKKLGDHDHKIHDKHEFSLLICAYS